MFLGKTVRTLRTLAHHFFLEVEPADKYSVRHNLFHLPRLSLLFDEDNLKQAQKMFAKLRYFYEFCHYHLPFLMRYFKMHIKYVYGKMVIADYQTFTFASP